MALAGILFYLLILFFLPIIWILLFAVFVLTTSWHNKIKKRFAAGSFKSGRFLMYLDLAILAGGIAVVAEGTFATPYQFEISRETFNLTRLPEKLDGMVVAHLSDFHLGSSLTPKTLEDIVVRVLNEKPDIIFLTGDYFSRGLRLDKEVLNSLRRLRAPLGTYAVLGNHDYYIDGGKVAEILRKAGIVVLLNESASIPFSEHKFRINIIGVDDRWNVFYGGSGANIEKALRDLNQEDFTILLAHQPKQFDEIEAYPVDIMFSGHTHGGQVGLPGELGKSFSLARLISPYVFGRYEKDDKMMYVSSGLGTSGLPIRIGIKPEIGIFTLHKDKSLP